MDETFDLYVVFGTYRLDSDNGRSYHKVPLFASLSLAQAQYEWKLFEEHRDWLPEGATYLNCFFDYRRSNLYSSE